MRRSRQISLSPYVKIPFTFSNDDTGGIANSSCLLATDLDGDGNVELVIGLLGGKLVIVKSLEQTTPWATSASVLGSIIAVNTGFITRPRIPTTDNINISTSPRSNTTPINSPTPNTASNSIHSNHPQLIVISAEGACYIFELYGTTGGYGSLIPTACYPITPSIQCATILHTRTNGYDDLCVATTEKSLHVYGMSFSSTSSPTSSPTSDWQEMNKWTIEEGTVSSISTMPDHTNNLIVGMQSGKMLILDLTFNNSNQNNNNSNAQTNDSNQNNFVRALYPTSMPDRRAIKIAKRQRRQQIKYQQFLDIEKSKNRATNSSSRSNGRNSSGNNNGGASRNDSSQEREQTPMSLMMQMQQNHAEQRMQEQMQMDATGGSRLSSGGLSSRQIMGFRGSLAAAQTQPQPQPQPHTLSPSEMEDDVSFISSTTSSLSPNSSGIASTTKNRINKTGRVHSKSNSNNNEGGTTGNNVPSIGSWTTVHGHLHGWNGFPNTYVPWIENVKNNSTNSKEKKDNNDRETKEKSKVGGNGLVVAATLEGDMSIWNVATGKMCWYDTVGSSSGHGQIFAIESVDITGDDVDELIVCAWDGTTYLFDRQCDCAMFDFGENVLGFIACELTVSLTPTAAKKHSDNTSSYVGVQPCLVYGTNDAVTIYVMGSTTTTTRTQGEDDGMNGMNGEDDGMDDCTGSLELIGSATEVSRQAVVHDSGRPVCYIRTPSLEEALRYRNKNLPARAIKLAKKYMFQNENDVKKDSDTILLNTFYRSCLLQDAGGSGGQDPIDVLKMYRDELKEQVEAMSE